MEIERYRPNAPADRNTENGARRDEHGSLLKHSGDPTGLKSMLSSMMEELVQQESLLLSPAERKTIVEWMQKDPFFRGRVLQNHEKALS